MITENTDILSIPFASQFIYKALLHSIRTNTRVGFINNDQEHPAYKMGAIGNENYSEWDDDSEHNQLYRVMLLLSKSLRKDQSFRPEDHIDTWQDFCRLAVAGSKHPKS